MSTRRASARGARTARARNICARAVRMELRVYESLWRAIARRPLVPADGTGFGYHRPVLAVLIVFMAVSAIEIPIIDALMHRWLPARIFFLALGIWGLTWMIGLLCAYLTRPHTVSPSGIRIREGLELDIPIAWEDFSSIRLHPTAVDPNDPDRPKGRVFEDGEERICAIRMSSETNLELRFERPTNVELPGIGPRGGAHEVDVLRFWVDAPEDFLAAVRNQLDALRRPL